MCVHAFVFHSPDAAIVMHDSHSKGSSFVEIQPLIDFLPRRGTDSRIISLFLPLPHFTGNFHVVNGGIDWRSALFVLRSVHHLRRKQEGGPRCFDVIGGSDQWLQHTLLFSWGCLWFSFLFSAKYLFGSVYCYHPELYTLMVDVFISEEKQLSLKNSC